MSESLFDVLVIGFGPGGSSAATLLARSGHRVLVLEKEKFPRFHVGESLLPLDKTLFEELGIWRYERRVKRAMRVYWRLVEYYYTTPFMEFFLEPRPTLDVPAAVLAVLAGDLEPSWHIRWRLSYFYLLVWVQRWKPLVPRISFAPAVGEDSPPRA